MSSIPNTPTHPAWCAGEPVCTAAAGGIEATHRGHPSGQPRDLPAPMVEVTLTLFQAAPGWPTEPHVTAVISDGLEGPRPPG
jgi:hypothetical protein